MSLVSVVEWNVSLGSADVSWGRVRAIRTAAKETTRSADTLFIKHLKDLIPARALQLGIQEDVRGCKRM